MDQNINRLEFGELPVSDTTLLVSDSFMLSDNLDEQEIIEVLRYPSMARKLTGNPFKLKFTMLLMCVGGFLRVRIGMREQKVTAGHLLVITGGAIVECLDTEMDARVVLIAFSDKFIMQAPRMSVYPAPGILSSLHATPCIPLDREEQNDILNLYRMMRHRLGNPRFRSRSELAESGLRTLFCYISGLIAPAEEPQAPTSRKQVIFDDFLNLVDSCGVRERALTFYADRLCITTRYLSRVVAETSGRTAREWINMRVILEAKVLLREGRLSVQQISERLNFANQSFFGSFFKRATGLSPNAYRKG
ncbi:MAG: helix-turn-helix domain-containing protein [Muribaculaceae bacterium]|nr:helix-turn-helix domain-containing protein [Muribaculaceae bacterium]